MVVDDTAPKTDGKDATAELDAAGNVGALPKREGVWVGCDDGIEKPEVEFDAPKKPPADAAELEPNSGADVAVEKGVFAVPNAGVLAAPKPKAGVCTTIKQYSVHSL